MPAARLPDRLIPEAVRRGVRPWYGDLHNHCGISYGHGSLEGALANAKRQLDFVSITGHAWWPDMPVDDPRVAHIVDFHIKGFARLASLWPAHFETLAAYAEPGGFTVFPGYEMHSFAHGDYTIVLRDLEEQPTVRAESPDGLLEALRAAHGDAAFAFPHHIGYRTGARGINWDTFREELSPVLEMISMHGCAETSLTDRPFLHSMGPSDGTNTVHWGLNQGHRFGVLGNTDHHSGFPGSYGHGRSAVYAAENTPDGLWQAIHARHSNALTGDNAHLLMTLGEVMQGDTVPKGTEGQLGIEAVAGSFIDCIDLLRNGRLIHRISPQLTPSAIDRSSGFESILVLELGWGSRGAYHDWTGSLAVSGGSIEAVETRLRGAEIVSPTEGDHEGDRADRIGLDGDVVNFAIRAHSNPNNSTPTTQALALRVRLDEGARIALNFDDQSIEVPVERLIGRAMSGNIGPIDSPAWRLHPLPFPEQWQWQGRLQVEPMQPGDWLMTRMRQQNGQWAWTSPIFCN